MTSRIGLLLPNSNFINRLAADIRQQFAEGFGGEGLAAPEFIIEATAYNASRGDVRAGVQDLLIKHDVSLVVAPLNPGMIASLEDLARGQQTPLFVLTMGEDVCQDDLAPPWVFVNSFGLWRSAWLTGHWATRRFGPRICTICAAHDGGYGMTFASGLGVEASGGTVAATLPAPLELDDAAAGQLLDNALGAAPDALILLCSDAAQDAFGRAMAARAEAIPFVGLPPHAYLTGARRPPTTLPGHPAFSSWDPGSEASDRFIRGFDGDDGRPAHAYAVLARETGALIARAATAGDAAPRAATFRAALLEASFDGPRGPVSFDRQGLEIIAPQHRLAMRAEGAETIVERAATPAPLELLDEHVALARRNLSKSGWLNPYLVA